MSRCYLFGPHDLLADPIGVLVKHEIDRGAGFTLRHSIEENARLDADLPFPARWFAGLTMVCPPFFVALEQLLAVTPHRLQLRRGDAVAHDEVALAENFFCVHLGRHGIIPCPVKEVKAKSEDSGSKARQYLEALLRIPFGIYKEEPILKIMKDINKNFISILNLFLHNSSS